MTLQECIDDLDKLDPYDVIQCGLDNFSAYEYVELPQELRDKVDQLSDDDQELWDEHTTEYIRKCQGY
jgi:hypothetical protein